MEGGRGSGGPGGDNAYTNYQVIYVLCIITDEKIRCVLVVDANDWVQGLMKQVQ